MSHRNWVRVRDALGNQFDLADDDSWPEGVTAVKDYPVFRGASGRPGKASTARKGAIKVSDSTSDTGDHTINPDAGVTGKEKE